MSPCVVVFPCIGTCARTPTLSAGGERAGRHRLCDLTGSSLRLDAASSPLIPERHSCGQLLGAPLLSWPGRSTQGAGTWGSPQPLDATPARAARCLPAPQVPAPTGSGRRGFAPPSEPERLGAPCPTATGCTLPAHPSGSPRQARVPLAAPLRLGHCLDGCAPPQHVGRPLIGSGCVRRSGPARTAPDGAQVSAEFLPAPLLSRDNVQHAKGVLVSSERHHAPMQNRCPHSRNPALVHSSL